jgi:hypothetical protein
MKDMAFWVKFIAGNSNQLQKFSCVLNVFTLLNLEIFNSQNVENK